MCVCSGNNACADPRNEANGVPQGGGVGLVLCAMCKIHLLAMCYVSFCLHCYVKLKEGAMQKYNLCYVLCKSCTEVLCIENANWWYLYAKLRSAMCYLQKIRCYMICKMTISCCVLCKIKWPLLCAMCWEMASAMCYVKPLEGPRKLPPKIQDPRFHYLFHYHSYVIMYSENHVFIYTVTVSLWISHVAEWCYLTSETPPIQLPTYIIEMFPHS